MRVKDALDAVNDIVVAARPRDPRRERLALIASLLVLAGALAAGHRARLYDAVILKTLGATRARLLARLRARIRRARLATAVFGLIAGVIAGRLIVTRVMNMPFRLELEGAVLASALAVVVSVSLGLLGTWRVLSQKPAPYLRNL